MESSNAQELVGVTEAARIVGVDPATLRRWAKADLVPSFTTPTGHLRFRRSDLSDVIRPTRAS